MSRVLKHSATNFRNRFLTVEDILFKSGQPVRQIRIPKKNLDYGNVNFPLRTKLPVTPKLPVFYANTTSKAPRLKGIDLYRQIGEEHNKNYLQMKQFGIVALSSGRLKHGHFEMMRNVCYRNLQSEKSFAFYRVDCPNIPFTTRGVGRRMGGGKGNIRGYFTPIKAGQVVLEVGGKVVWEEVKPWLDNIAMKLPCKAIAVNHSMLENLKGEEERLILENENPYTYEWIVRNNMLNCHNFLTVRDRLWFGRFSYTSREVEHNIKFGKILNLTMNRG